MECSLNKVNSFQLLSLI